MGRRQAAVRVSQAGTEAMLSLEIVAENRSSMSENR
jgi:hypothetical protein